MAVRKFLVTRKMVEQVVVEAQDTLTNEQIAKLAEAAEQDSAYAEHVVVEYADAGP